MAVIKVVLQNLHPQNQLSLPTEVTKWAGADPLQRGERRQLSVPESEVDSIEASLRSWIEKGIIGFKRDAPDSVNPLSNKTTKTLQLIEELAELIGSFEYAVIQTIAAVDTRLSTPGSRAKARELMGEQIIGLQEFLARRSLLLPTEIVDAARSSLGSFLGMTGPAATPPNDPMVEFATATKQAKDRIRTWLEEEQATESTKPSCTRSALTGLRDLAQLDVDLPLILTEGAPTALIFADMDNLKALNEAIGHDRADLVIKELAVALETGSQHRATVYHRSGDEFLLVLSNSTAEEAATFMSRLIDKIAKSSFQGLDAGKITVSAGVAMAGDEANLKSRANEALYAAKQQGKARAVVWTEAHARANGKCETTSASA